MLKIHQIEILNVKISKEFFKPIIITAIYIPPDNINEAMFNELQQLMSFLKRQQYELIICGDFNVDYNVKSADTKKLSCICTEFGLS